MNRTALIAAALLAFVCAFTTGADTGENTRALVYTPNFDGNSQAYESGVAELFAEKGYAVERLRAEELCDPGRLTEPKRTVLVLPDAGRLPLGSIGPVQDFLRQGARLVALNTPAWREVLVQADGAWMAVSDFRRQHARQIEKRVLVDWGAEDLTKWARAFRSTELQGAYRVTEEGPEPGQRSLEASVTKLDGWDSILKKYEQSPFSATDELVVFSAKSLGGATHLAVEWEERDGSRWIATVALSKEWTQYALTADDFHYWESVPGRKDSRFNPGNAARLGITLAFTHTGYADRDLKYAIGPVFAATLEAKYRNAFSGYTVPPIETLCPGYKFFVPQDVAGMHLSGFVGDTPVALAQGEIRAMHPRPQAYGFDKKRGWAWEPILEARSGKGDMRGTVGAMMTHTAGLYHGGMWVSIGIGDRSWYLSPEGRSMLGAVAARLQTPLAVVDAGADRYAYFEGQPVRLGMTVANQGTDDGRDIQGLVRVKSGDQVIHEAKVSATLDAEKQAAVEAVWLPERWEDGGCTVDVTVTSGDAVLGRGAHEINAWRPKAKPDFVVTRNGGFSMDGKPWRPHGVNYMPSSGVAAEDTKYFEQWLSPQSYDPKVVQRDLERCASLGFNALSVFLYKDYAKDQNLVDLLMRMERLGMKANVSLRPGTPMEAAPTEACEMIKTLHLAQNDTVFAYDLAWEPQFRPSERDPFNGAWAAWIEERFGSLENAEKLWIFAVPRDKDGQIANFTEEMIGREGPWSAYIAAYRRFLDTLLYEKYSQARTLVRQVDPNHHVSFRMSMASDPTDSQTNTFVYDFAYLAGAVDVLEPEAYGRLGDWERVRPGWFTREYARWANAKIPMIWAEAGVHAWDMASMSTPPDKLNFQAQFYEDFYKMMTLSAADGIFWWWYPGGFRSNENSDYGVINPDGTDRPVSRVIRAHAKEFVEAPAPRGVTVPLAFDRDKHTNGLSGVYKEIGTAFWNAIDRGEVPGLRTEGTGSDSANCPLTGVGNLTGPSTYPAKYLDAFIDRVEVGPINGNWVTVPRDVPFSVGSSAPLRVRVTVTNLGEATLLSAGDAAGRDGAVYLTCPGADSGRVALPKTLKRFEQAIVELELSNTTLTAPRHVELGFIADNRIKFGPKYKITFVP